jgi:hypothetical protein
MKKQFESYCAKNDERYCQLALTVSKMTTLLETTAPKATKAHKLAYSVDVSCQAIQESAYDRDQQLTRKIVGLNRRVKRLEKSAKVCSDMMNATTRLLDKLTDLSIKHGNTLKGVDVLLQNTSARLEKNSSLAKSRQIW